MCLLRQHQFTETELRRLIFLPALRKMGAFHRIFRDHPPASQVAIETGMTPKAVQRVTDEVRRQLGMTRAARRRRREIPAQVFETLEKDSTGRHSVFAAAWPWTAVI